LTRRTALAVNFQDSSR